MDPSSTPPPQPIMPVPPAQDEPAVLPPPLVAQDIADSSNLAEEIKDPIQSLSQNIEPPDKSDAVNQANQAVSSGDIQGADQSFEISHSDQAVAEPVVLTEDQPLAENLQPVEAQPGVAVAEAGIGTEVEVTSNLIDTSAAEPVTVIQPEIQPEPQVAPQPLPQSDEPVDMFADVSPDADPSSTLPPVSMPTNQTVSSFATPEPVDQSLRFVEQNQNQNLIQPIVQPIIQPQNLSQNQPQDQPIGTPINQPQATAYGDTQADSIHPVQTEPKNKIVIIIFAVISGLIVLVALGFVVKTYFLP